MLVLIGGFWCFGGFGRGVVVCWLCFGLGGVCCGVTVV